MCETWLAFYGEITDEVGDLRTGSWGKCMDLIDVR
jgi:hypothetical protein